MASSPVGKKPENFPEWQCRKESNLQLVLVDKYQYSNLCFTGGKWKVNIVTWVCLNGWNEALLWLSNVPQLPGRGNLGPPWEMHQKQLWGCKESQPQSVDCSLLVPSTKRNSNQKVLPVFEWMDCLRASYYCLCWVQRWSVAATALQNSSSSTRAVWVALKGDGGALVSLFGMYLWNSLHPQPNRFIYLLSVHALISLKWAL